MKPVISRIYYLLLVCSFCLLHTGAKARQAGNLPLSFAEIQTAPEYPGGPAEMGKFINANFKWSQAAIDAKLRGRVILSFVVEENGGLSDVKVLRDLGMGAGEEAVRVLKSMPAWKPGTKDNKPARVAFTLPLMLSADAASSKTPANVGRLIVIDGKLYTHEDVEKLRADTAAQRAFVKLLMPAPGRTTTILSPAEATEKYGEKGKDGAIVVSSAPGN